MILLALLAIYLTAAVCVAITMLVQDLLYYRRWKKLKRGDYPFRYTAKEYILRPLTWPATAIWNFVCDVEDQ